MGGTQQWSKAVGVSGRYTTIRSIAFNAQNNFFITGSCPPNAKKTPDLTVSGCGRYTRGELHGQIISGIANTSHTRRGLPLSLHHPAQGLT